MKPRTREEEKVALDKALTEFANDCRARLHQMVDRGKRGWDDPAQEVDVAEDLLRDADAAFVDNDRLHLHDISNRAMMLWWQAWRMKGTP